MSTTYAAHLSAFLLLSAAVSGGQSLEDKVSQARRLQAQSMTGVEERMLDSIRQERRNARSSEVFSPLGFGVSDETASDSMIAGPRDTSLRDTLGFDSLLKSDSLARRGRFQFRKPPPKRYEQKIFAKVDRSAFSSARGAAGRDHILGPGDAVTVSLWGDKEKEYSLELNGEGKIFLEGVGLIPLGGRNLNEAQVAVKERLARIYSGINRGTAHVDVSLGRVGPIKVFVLGEVKLPGGYVFTGNTSILSAIYFAEGPTDIGTVRNLQLTRAGKSQFLDLYQYLLKGKALAPSELREGDILFSGRAEALVEVSGDVGRPAIYELKKGEGIKELLEFAGGLNATAASHKMTLQRIGEGGIINHSDLSSPKEYLSGQGAFELKDGDRVLVEKSTEIARNFITITGPVKYPGTYSADGITNVQDVVKKAGGLREEAFLGRAHVLRFKPDGSSQLFAYSLDTSDVGAIGIQPRDNIILYSLKEMYIPDSVEIAGAVFNPGKYEFREGMSVKDLVMQAGGFLPQHESGKFLVFRGGLREQKVDLLDLSVTKGLDKSSETFTLNPRDFVQVPMDPLWYSKEVVTLDGLFMRPGKYVLLNPGEKLSAVIARAGGFKGDAYVEGGRFIRTRDSVGRIGVDIRRALNRPGTKDDIALVGGDSIFIPARVTTVKVIGEVGFETSVVYKSGSSVAYYVQKAGGFTRRSERDRIVVQYANGETSRDGYFNRKPDAGSVIYVPQGPEPVPINWIAGINALLGTVGVAAALILSIQAISGK